MKKIKLQDYAELTGFKFEENDEWIRTYDELTEQYLQFEFNIDMLEDGCIPSEIQRRLELERQEIYENIVGLED